MTEHMQHLILGAVIGWALRGLFEWSKRKIYSFFKNRNNNPNMYWHDKE